MPISEQDLNSFTSYARERLGDGDANSLADLVAQWEAQCEREETIADVLQGQEDIAAEKGKPVEQAFADIRAKLGLAK